jgi:hypothetical protein
MEQIILLIVVLNSILLIALIVSIKKWEIRHARISEKRFALIFLGYFSFSFISEIAPAFLINPSAVLITILGFLLLLWGIGYPFIRWLYRQFMQPK